MEFFDTKFLTPTSCFPSQRSFLRKNKDQQYSSQREFSSIEHFTFIAVVHRYRTVCTGCKLVSMCEHTLTDLPSLKCYASSLFPSLIFTSIVFFWTQAFISRKFTRRFLHGCGIFLDLFLIMICCFYFYATTMGPVTIDNCKVVT